MLVVLNSVDDPSRHNIVLDPNLLDARGATTIDWFEPSLDGRLVALSLSQHGSEIGTLHLYDVAGGRELGAPIPRVQAPTAGGSLAWSGDGTGFWYTRYPGSERPPAERFFYQQVYFHRIGGDWQNDPLVLGTAAGLPRVAEIFLSSQYLDNSALAQVQNGDGGDYAHYLLRRDGALQLSAFDDKIVEVASGPDGALFALSRAGAANGKILKLKPPFTARELPAAEVIVPESEVTIQLGGALTLTRTRLLVRDIVGGPNQVRIFDHSGTAQGLLPLPEAAAVGDLAPLPDGSVLYAVRTYLRPRYVARWDAATGKAEDTKFADTAAYDFDDVGVPARIRRLQGRHESAGQYHPQEGRAARRQPSGAALWLRRLWREPKARISRLAGAGVARRRRQLCDRQSARRRRVRRALALGRQSHPQAERVR